MRFSIFKQHKNKRFNYTPRFYDERKERLDNLKRKHGLIDGDSGQKTGYSVTSFRDEWKQNSKIKNDRNSRVRLMVIIVVLLLITVFILNKLEIRIFNG